MRRTPSSTLLVDLCRTLQSPADGTPSFIGCLSTVASSQPPKGCRSSIYCLVTISAISESSKRAPREHFLPTANTDRKRKTKLSNPSTPRWEKRSSVSARSTGQVSRSRTRFVHSCSSPLRSRLLPRVLDSPVGPCGGSPRLRSVLQAEQNGHEEYERDAYVEHAIVIVEVHSVIQKEHPAETGQGECRQRKSMGRGP